MNVFDGELLERKPMNTVKVIETRTVEIESTHFYIRTLDGEPGCVSVKVREEVDPRAAEGASVETFTVHCTVEEVHAVLLAFNSKFPHKAMR